MLKPTFEEGSNQMRIKSALLKKEKENRLLHKGINIYRTVHIAIDRYIFKPLCNPSRLARNKRFAQRVMQQNELFREIEIETVNRCNGICPFCPVNVHEPQRPYAKMTDELFHKIIQELADIHYTGQISLFSNNEPFLDERILAFHKYAREKLPDAFFNLYTNGSLLTLERFQELLKYCDRITIDNYNDDREVNPNLQDVYQYLHEHPELSEKVNFSFRLQNEVLLSRGGQAPNKKNQARAENEICLLPFRQMIVRPTGEISLCCSDALGVYTMGDVKSQSLTSIWNSQKYEEIRHEMYVNKRKNLKLCNRCDMRTEVQQLRRN